MLIVCLHYIDIKCFIILIKHQNHVLGRYFSLLYDQHEIWTLYSQSKQEGAITFASHLACSSGLIQNFLDHYTALQMQKAVSAYL